MFPWRGLAVWQPAWQATASSKIEQTDFPKDVFTIDAIPG